MKNKTKQNSTEKAEIETLEVAGFAAGHSQHIYMSMYENGKCKQIVDFLQEKFKNRHHLLYLTIFDFVLLLFHLPAHTIL